MVSSEKVTICKNTFLILLSAGIHFCFSSNFSFQGDQMLYLLGEMVLRHLGKIRRTPSLSLASHLHFSLPFLEPLCLPFCSASPKLITAPFRVFSLPSLSKASFRWHWLSSLTLVLIFLTKLSKSCFSTSYRYQLFTKENLQSAGTWGEWWGSNCECPSLVYHHYIPATSINASKPKKKSMLKVFQKFTVALSFSFSPRHIPPVWNYASSFLHILLFLFVLHFTAGLHDSTCFSSFKCSITFVYLFSSYQNLCSRLLTLKACKPKWINK